MTGPLTVLTSTPSSMSRIVWTDDWGTNVNELRQALIQEWNNIPQAEINSRGGHTCY